MLTSQVMGSLHENAPAPEEGVAKLGGEFERVAEAGKPEAVAEGVTLVARAG